jgi:uncharacterized protein (TIGR00269 family)
MKCAVCRGPAVIDMARHNVNLCGEHFVKHCHEQVAKAIRRHDMIQPTDRVLVAVSGGKDSLALWDILLALGYQVDGLFVGLGIGEYSTEALTYVRAFAHERSLVLVEVDLAKTYGFDIPTAATATRRVPCSACGTSKRHVFDHAATEGGYDVMATGHNLDDEAAVLLGNVLHWDIEYLARQRPALPARPGFPRKVKPLVRLAERESAAYCVVRGIDYQVEECPMAAGNRHLGYKEALNAIEATSPGSKHAFYDGFLQRMSPTLVPSSAAEQGDLQPCIECGAPTTSDICSFCRIVARSAPHEPVPIEVHVRKGRGRAASRAADAASERAIRALDTSPDTAAEPLHEPVDLIAPVGGGER